MTRRLLILSLSLIAFASTCYADDVWTGGKPYSYTSAFSSESVDPSSTETASSVHRGAPGAAAKAVYYSITGTGGSPSVSIYVIPSLDGTTFLPTSTNVSVAHVTSDGTGLVALSSPYSLAPVHRIVPQNHSSTVTATCDVIVGGN